MRYATGGHYAPVITPRLLSITRKAEVHYREACPGRLSGHNARIFWIEVPIYVQLASHRVARLARQRHSPNSTSTSGLYP